MNEADRVLDRELERLGEPPPTEDERRQGGADEPAIASDPELATCAALFELSRTQPVEGLSEVEGARAWRKVERRIGDADAAAADRTRRRAWIVVATAMAAAAIVTFVLVRPQAHTGEVDDEQHEVAAALGTQARAGLEALGVSAGSQSRRADQMMRDYEARLAREGAG